MRSIIDPALPQWKGNFHCHTTGSDGRVTPAEAARQYEEAGYDFLAITDHRRVTDPREAGERRMLMIPGVELDYRIMGRHPQAVHIVGVGVEPGIMETPGLMETPQQGIDAIRRCGGKAIFAHPAWSLCPPETIEGLWGLSAVEIYNRCSDAPWNARRADSSEVIDLCCADGCLLPLVGADDAHQYNGDQCHTALIACAPERTRDAILDALEQGKVYASQGPRFLEIRLEDDAVFLKCTPCSRVVFYTNMFYARDRVIQGQNITEAAYQIHAGVETFVRVEITDDQGRSAWSSPIALD